MPDVSASAIRDGLADRSPELAEILRQASAVARQTTRAVWAVGGVVRDLLGRLETRDLDLVVLGDARRFATDLAARVGGEPRNHPRFLNLHFTSHSRHEIDVARARAESYPGPAALPVVRPGTLMEDLFRRDFTINAMALRLDDDASQLVDPFAGRRDLESRQLRVLHDRSFIDDPTRILRGLRLVGRMDLELETRTAELATDAVLQGAFSPLSGRRLRQELEALLEWPDRTRRALAALPEPMLVRALSGEPIVDEGAMDRLESLSALQGRDSRPRPTWIASLVALTWNLSVEERRQLGARLALGRSECRLLVSVPDQVERTGRSIERLNSTYERFALAENLGDFGRAAARCWGSEPLARFLEQEWPQLESRIPTLSGRELVDLGFASGPRIGEALRRTLRARLEGRIGPDEELDFATRWLRRQTGSGH